MVVSLRPPLAYQGQARPGGRSISGFQDVAPDLDTPQGAAINAAQKDSYIQQIQAALAASSGFERIKLQAQLEDAEKGRANAYKIAQLQAETSRYGVDAQREVALKQLKENARQFDATHALEMQKFGVSYAQVATEYLSTPDRFFQAADFINMSGRALGRTTEGAQGPSPYLYPGMPTPKTEGDFAVLAGYTAPTPGQLGQPVSAPKQGGGTGSGGGSGTPVPSSTTDATPAPTPTSALPPDATPSAFAYPQQATPAGSAVINAAAGPGAGKDARAKALKAMIDAVPPSGVQGLDENDFAVLQAARALYSTNLAPGTLEQMRPGHRAILGSAGRRLGIDVNDYLADYERSRPGQRSVRAA